MCIVSSAIERIEIGNTDRNLDTSEAGLDGMMVATSPALYGSSSVVVSFVAVGDNDADFTCRFMEVVT